MSFSFRRLAAGRQREVLPSAGDLTLTGKWRDELAGGQIIQGAEAATQLGVAQAVLAIERSEKLFGGFVLAEAHRPFEAQGRQECPCHYDRDS